MSELTMCNRCSLDLIEERASRDGVTVTVGSPSDVDGWIAVRRSDKEKPVAWFAALTEGCVC